MPRMFLCAFPSCGKLLDHKGYCPKHVPTVEKKDWRESKTKPFANATRSNPWYQTARWKALRQEVLERDGYRCCRCGLLFPVGLQVHHRIPPRGSEELFFDINNLECVCRADHLLETGREIRERK